ncbi:MAG TPA: hypothetical protein VNF48_00535, partial [Gammaproteobacteria bacterium]|nr:hypothetical protein [Gammaproteobacteria bacterium]
TKFISIYVSPLILSWSVLDYSVNLVIYAKLVSAPGSDEDAGVFHLKPHFAWVPWSVNRTHIFNTKLTFFVGLY